MKKFWRGLFFFAITMIILVLIVVVVFACSTSVRNSYNKAYRRMVGWYEEPMIVEYTLDSLDSIEVKTVSQNISVKVSNSATEITVRYYSNWDNQVADNRASDLKIEEKFRGIGAYVVIPQIDWIVNKDIYIPIEITVPEGTDLSKLKAETTSGNIEINGIEADTANLSATNMNITVNDCDFGSTNISNTSGTTDIKNSSLGDDGKITHTGGNIKLTNCTIDDDFKIKGSCTLTNCVLGDDIKIENTSGNIKISKTEFIGLEISSTSGDITVSNMIEIELCNFNLSAGSGAIKVSGTNQGTIYNVTPSGWQSKLKINAPSGNITIS